MSNVPQARELVTKAMGMLPPSSPAYAALSQALPLLTRENPVKVVGRPVKVTGHVQEVEHPLRSVGLK